MREISRGNMAYEKTVIGQFISCIPNDLAGLQTALGKKDYTSLSRIAHDMKTSVGIMGLTSILENDLDKLEDAGVGHADLQVCVSNIEDICTKAVEEAKDVYSTITS